MTDTFGFLLSDTARLLRKHFDERARQHGATRARWKALLGISRNEGINQGTLADLLEVEPITLCRLIDRLEESGLVERRRDPNDRRAWQLFLTDKAGPVLEELHATADELMAQALSAISGPQIELMTGLLHQIRQNLSTSETREAVHG